MRIANRPLNKEIEISFHFILLDSGSGRVTFSSHKSYMKAVNAAFVEVKTPKFTKKVKEIL